MLGSPEGLNLQQSGQSSEPDHLAHHLKTSLFRNNILRSSRRLRNIIASPAFQKLFGEAKPNLKGGRRSVFGGEDELKSAPKGVDKAHKCVNP